MATIDTYSGTPNGSVRIGDAVGDEYNAQQFTATATGTIPSVKFFMRLTDGTPTDGVTVQVWTDSSDSPGSLISGATVNIAQASIVNGNNSWDVSEFTTATFGTPPSVTNGTKYWVVMKRQGAVDAVNYNNMWDTDPASYSGGLFKLGTIVPVWGSAINVDQAYEVSITEAVSPASTAKKHTLTLMGVG